jgi:aminoglycoside phosphotransferase (APT) family kinase protein
MPSMGPLLGKGRQAEIYEWDSGRVVKLFYPGYSLESAEREEVLTRAVAATGLPVPQVFGQVQIDGRYGFIMSRVEGISLLDRFAIRPWGLMGDAKMFVRLHVQVNAARADDLPPLRERLRANITEAERLPDEWRAKAHSMLNALPDGEFVCHGDLHPDNVMIASDDPVLIDWPGVQKGTPAADFARTLLVLMTATPPPHIPKIQRLMMNAGRSLFTHTYRQHYYRLTRLAPQYVRTWMLPVCAARFNENLTDDLPALHRLMAKLVAETQGDPN